MLVKKRKAKNDENESAKKDHKFIHSLVLYSEYVRLIFV